MRRYFAPVVLACVTAGVAYSNLFSDTNRIVLMGVESMVGADPQRQGEASVVLLACVTCVAWVLSIREARAGTGD